VNWLLAWLVLSIAGLAQTTQVAASGDAPFAPLEQWRGSILSGDELLFRSFYSWKPEAVIQNPAGKTDSRDEIAFWNNLKVRDLKLQVIESQSPKPGMREVVLQAEIKSGIKGADQPLYLLEGQLWVQQGDVWRMVAVKRGAVTQLKQPVQK
jgi:hypothetical protein